MDVDFSQVGQNVALQNAGGNVARRDDLSAEESVQARQDRRLEQNAQASGVAADTNEEVNNTSINIESAVAEVSEFVQSQNRQLAFSIDEKSERQVVKVTDSESGDVIRQIPSEEVLALSERIKELQSDVGVAVGVLFNKQA